MKMFRFRGAFWLLGLAVLVVSVAGVRATLRDGHADSAAAQTAAAEEQSVICFGHVDVEDGVSALSPLQPGRVLEVPVKENLAVKAGTVLLRLDDQQARNRLQEARQDVKAAQAQLVQLRRAPSRHQSQVKQQHEKIQTTQHRLAATEHVLTHKKMLHQGGFLNIEEVHSAAELVEELRSAVRAEREKLRELELIDPVVEVTRAEADLAAKQARFAQAQQVVDECLLRAPVDGKVLRILTRPGEVLGPQQKQPALLFCSNTPRVIRAEIEQEFTDGVSVGQTALIQVDAPSARKWRGKVMSLSDWYTDRRSVLQAPRQVNDVRTLECLIALDPGQVPFRIGQRVRVTILAK